MNDVRIITGSLEQSQSTGSLQLFFGPCLTPDRQTDSMVSADGADRSFLAALACVGIVNVKPQETGESPSASVGHGRSETTELHP